MADKSNTISKKTIIAIAIVIVLLFIAGLSVGIFLADKGSTEAVDRNQSTGESQTTEENKNSGENKANDDQKANENKTGENNAVDNNENNQVAENNAVDNNENNQVAENNTIDNNGNNQVAGNNNVANNENNQVAENNRNNVNGVTTNTNINEVGETTITRVEEQEKLVSRDFWNWWTPSTVVASGSAVAERLIPQTSDFTVEKIATTGVGEDKLVYANKNITYTIKVTNNGEQELKNIEITDKIPEQTTFVSIDDAQNSGTTILENDTVIGLKWIVTVPAKESIEVKFTVKVNENATGTISNAAIVNGKESNEEKTSIINAKKSSKIIEKNNVEVKDGLEVAKLGDKIKYTITATNTGDISGKTTIEDTVPVGTELIESSVTDAGKITTTTDNRKQISWNVELGANETIERTFIVEVKDISGKIENVATVGGVPTNPDKKDTADIKVVKEVTGIKRNQENLGKDVKVQAGDVIEYKIKVTNTGSLDLTNVVLDEKLVGININAKDLKIGDLKAGDSKEIFATYTVTYEKDIKGKADENGNPLPIINEVFVKGESVPTKPDQKSEEVSDDSKVETPVKEAPSYDISKIADKEKVTTAGEEITYTITVKNTGNTILKDLTVRDAMLGIDKVISEIKINGTNVISKKYTVTQDDIDKGGVIKNIVTVGDKETERDVDVEQNPGYTAVKTADKEKVTTAGEVITYTITVTNTGNTTLKDIPVVDDMAGINTKIDTIEVGKSASVTGTYTVKQSDIDKGGKIHNVATVGDKSPEKDVPVEQNSSYTAVKTADKEKVTAAGEIITYTITVTNTGNTTLKDIPVVDDMAGINTKIDTIEVGKSASVTGTYTVKQSDIDKGGKIHNVATVGDKSPEKDVPVEQNSSYTAVKTADKEKVTAAGEIITYTITVTNTGNTTLKDIPVVDDMAGINTKIDTIEVGKSASVTGTYTVKQSDIDKGGKIHNVATVGDKSPEKDVPVEQNSSYTAVKTADKEKVTAAGEIITYTITVTNTGNTTLEDIKITDSLNVKYDDKDVNAGNTVYTIESLEPGKYVEIKVYYTVTAEDVKTEGTINNVATATAKDGTHDDDNDNKVVKNPNTQVTATKAWENMDSDAAKANTLTSIKLQVKNGDTVVAEQEVTEKDNWTYTFRNLPVYDANGNKITYTIDEAVVSAKDQAKLDLYEKSIKNGVITNTFKPERVTEKTDVTMTKVWEDNNNTFNTRPDSIILTVNGIDYEVTGTKKADSWSRTENLPKYDAEGREISYTATEKTVPTGYEKVSEEGLTVTNRANELINKTAYKADANGNIGSPATNKDTFAANETVYYKITLKNAGSEPISKTVTDEIPLRLTLNTVDGKNGESGTTDKGDNWTVTKNDKEQSVVTWEVKDLAAGETRELIIKATVVAEAEYKDICNKTIDGTTAYTAKLFVRKDGKVPYEGSGTGYDASLYTGELGTVYLNSSDLHYDTNANLKNDDLYYLIKNNNIITDMVAKGITRTQLVDALKTNGTTLADDEVVVWYVIKNESDGYHIDGVIRKISSLTEITNTAFTDKVSSDSTIKLEDIEIGQRGSITVKSITSSTDTVSTPMDVVFVLDTSGSMTYGLKNTNSQEESRAKAMVNAVNSSIKTIMSKNKDSRVGVVGFSGDASTIIPLENYAQGIDYLTREYSAGDRRHDSSQTIKSNVGNKTSREVTGGTNTQSGIKLGAEMLTSVQNTTTATVTLKDGTTKTITRTPLLILVTDGEPTYYYASETATGKVNGHGYTNETDENYYYWTLRTAKYCKKQITNKYYKNTDKTAKVFTIGIGLSGNEAVAMLDPTADKVNACNNNNWQQKALYDLITNNGTAPGAYSYADGSKTGEITESDLTDFLNTSIDSSSENEENRAITVEESKARRVELGNINTSKEFELKVGEKTYSSISAAQNAGYLKKDSKGYYIDLTKVERSTDVDVTYWAN